MIISVLRRSSSSMSTTRTRVDSSCGRLSSTSTMSSMNRILFSIVIIIYIQVDNVNSLSGMINYLVFKIEYFYLLICVCMFVSSMNARCILTSTKYKHIYALSHETRTRMYKHRRPQLLFCCNEKLRKVYRHFIKIQSRNRIFSSIQSRLCSPFIVNIGF